MLLARTKINKVVLLRPGALGDVLAVRSVIRFFKDAFSGVEVCLAAPGERGAFLRREDWADRSFDWDRGAFAWLFSDGEAEPPAQLQAVFSGSNVIIAYQDFPTPAAFQSFERSLERLAPAAGKVYCPSSPTHGHGQPIGEWLARAAVAFCERYGLLGGGVPDLSALADAAIAMPRTGAVPPGLESPYLVMHPGSGSRAKNWPIDEYIQLAHLLLAARGRDGEPCFRGLLTTAGEADGELGRRLAEAVPGALTLENPSLDELASALAYGKLYVGNDSGVSHLASAVAGEDGRRSLRAVFFGPSDAGIWSPPGSLVLDAGEDMRGMGADEAFERMRKLL